MDTITGAAMLNFHDLYQRYAKDVYRFAYWLSGSRQDAEDIVSETFVRAWLSPERIRTETVKAYLFSIARNFYLQQLRKRQREVSLDEEQHVDTFDLDALYSTRQTLQSVNEHLRSFAELDRTALILRVVHEMPYAEIARILSISLSAAKVKVHRVRLKLAAAHKD